MLAIELSASIDWAREIRGTMSIDMPVTPRACRASSSASFCRGLRKVISTAPLRMDSSSSTLGSLTASTMSEPQTSVFDPS